VAGPMTPNVAAGGKWSTDLNEDKKQIKKTQKNIYFTSLHKKTFALV
jgi:hypothetical protein